MASLDDVRRIAAGLPGAIEGEGRFGFGVIVRGKPKGFCWSWMERLESKKPKVENRDVLAISTPGLAAKEILMSSEPEKYVEDPHYNGYPAVLVRLEKVELDELEELLIEGWKTKASKAALAEFESRTP